MQRMMLAAASAVLLGTGIGMPAGDVLPVQGPDAYYASVPPAAWMPADTADSLYRLARQALNRGRYREAAEQFRTIYARYPQSAYAADAYYWEAFALQRIGGGRNLRRALAALELQRAEHPEATTRGDAEALRSRINADLARLGDAEAAAVIAQEAAEVAEAPEAPMPVAAPEPAAAPGVVRVGPSPRVPRVPRTPRVGRYGNADCEGEDDSRIFAIQALMNSNRERALPLLQKVLARRDTGSVCLRRFALMVAAQQRGAEATDLLLTSARSDPDQEVRTQAVFWLSQTDDPRVVPVLDSVMRNSTDEEVQSAALFAISQQRNTAARQLLRRYAERTDIPDELRARALFFLAQGGSPEDLAYLREAYGRLEGTEARQQILAAMMAQRSPEQARWLLGIAKNRKEDIELRKQALFFAGMSEISTADLIEVYNSLPDDPELRKHMFVVLGQRSGDSAAAAHLVRVAKTEKDPELRRMALFWLSQSDDPQATKLIEEMLEE